jgi:hypothetical protein
MDASPAHRALQDNGHKAVSNSPLARKFAGRFDAIVPGIRASATTRGKSRREADIGQAVRMNLDL